MAYRRGQAIFTGGELSEDMYARPDVEEFGIGLKTAYNVLVRKQGGVVGVVGTEHVCTLPDSAYAHRLTPFEFNTEQAYVNAWGNLTMCVIKDGALVLEDSENVVSITQASPGVIEVTAHGWAVNDIIYSTGIGGMTALNARYYRVNSAPDVDHITLKDLYGNVISTAALPAFTAGGVFARVMQEVSPYTSNADPNNAAAQVMFMDYAQSNDEGFFAHLDVEPQQVTRSAHNVWTITPQVRAATIAAPANVAVAATVGTGAITYEYVVTAINDVTGEESVASTSDSVTNDLSADPTYVNTITWDAVAGASRYNIYKNENGIYGFIGGTIGLTFQDGPASAAGGEITPDLSITPPQNYDPFADGVGYYPAAVEMHEARLIFGQLDTNPGAGFASQPTRFNNFNRSVPQRSDDVLAFRLLPGTNPIEGMCSLGDVLFCATASGEWTVSGSGVVNYLTPASATPHIWSTVGADRLKPLKVGGYALYVQKQGKSIHAFGPDPTNPSRYTSIDLTLLADHLLEDHFIVDWCYQQDPFGIVWIVRDDGVLLTLTFLPEFKIFAFTRVGLAGGAVAESCACIPAATHDEVYFAIKLTVNGGTRRHVVRLKNFRWGTDVADYWGLHNALLFDSTPTSTFDNLHHLEGKTDLAALADGFLVTGLTCTAGRVTLPSTFPSGASKVLIGQLPDDPLVETLPVAQSSNAGAPQGRRKRIVGATVKLKRSCGVYAGGREDKVYPIKMRKANLAAATPTPPFTGDLYVGLGGGFAKNGTMVIRGTAGLPFHVTGLFPDLEMSKANVKLTDADA